MRRSSSQALRSCVVAIGRYPGWGLVERSDGLAVERRAVRALIITPEREVLLLRLVLPETGQAFWIAPGGGLEPGESPDDALRRELSEEVGLTRFDIGPIVWRRHHTFDWAGGRLSQREDYRIVHVERFEPVMTDLNEAKTIERFQWVAISGLASFAERLTPLALPNILETYLAQGAPDSASLTEEVLVD